MAVEKRGFDGRKREHKATITGPDPKSNRSKKRANRGWRSLEESSRKHKRARRRSLIKRTQYGRLGEPGDKSADTGSFTHNCGGSQAFHKMK